MNGNRNNADNVQWVLHTMTTRLLSENMGVSEPRDGADRRLRSRFCQEGWMRYQLVEKKELLAILTRLLAFLWLSGSIWVNTIPEASSRFLSQPFCNNCWPISGEYWETCTEYNFSAAVGRCGWKSDSLLNVSAVPCLQCIKVTHSLYPCQGDEGDACSTHQWWDVWFHPWRIWQNNRLWWLIHCNRRPSIGGDEFSALSDSPVVLNSLKFLGSWYPVRGNEAADWGSHSDSFRLVKNHKGWLHVFFGCLDLTQSKGS